MQSNLKYTCTYKIMVNGYLSSANRMSGNLVQMEWTKTINFKVDVLPHTNRLYMAHPGFDTGLFVWGRTYCLTQVY